MIAMILPMMATVLSFAQPVYSLDQIIDERMGQALFDAISCEVIAVESAQPVTRTEPKKTVRVANDAQDKIARQPVGRRIDSHGKLFGGDIYRAEN